MMRWWAGLLCALALAAPAYAQPTTPDEWRATATRDLDAIRSIIATDTPIGASVAGPSYDAWFAAGYAQAQERLPQVTGAAGYYYTLAGYVNGFHDPHLSLRATRAVAPPRWPGFVATRSGDAVVVSWRDEADASAPPLGARIVSCDGATLDALAARNVFPFLLNAALPGDRRRAAPRLFLDTGNPFAPPPQACVFDHNGAQRTLALNWRPLPNPPTAFNAAFNDAGLGPSTSFGLADPAPGVVWIGVPSFAQDAHISPQLSSLMHQVQQRGDALRNGRAIVIDLRGNTGGNSDWARRLAQSVFGADYIASMGPINPGGAAVWRASPGNLAYWQNFNDEAQRQVTASTRVGAWSRDVVQGLERAVNRREAIWRQGGANSNGGGGLTQRRPQGASPFPARVYVLSNGSCVSSCLDFMDVALQVPGVQLIGAPTSADGALAEVRAVDLPSGEARFVFAQKIMVGRGRGAMEYYTADVAYDGPWSDAAVRAWTMQLIGAQTTSAAAIAQTPSP